MFYNLTCRVSLRKTFGTDSRTYSCFSAEHLTESFRLSDIFESLCRLPNSIMQTGDTQNEVGDRWAPPKETPVNRCRANEGTVRPNSTCKGGFELAAHGDCDSGQKPGRGEKQAARQLDRKRSRELLHTRWRCCSAVRTAVTGETPASFGFELKSYILRDLSTVLCSLSRFHLLFYQGMLYF